ncbi:MAG: hypothetical protein IIA83_12335 [Thaumarchaeota archaeon]|nr:hypothetical protein [Nitrososphaerota archaeon]
MTADNHEKLIIRPKNNHDLSLPSGNSIAASLLLRLYHLIQQKNFLEISTKIMESNALMAAENPFGFGQLLNTIYMYLQKPTEITLLNTVNAEILNSLTKKFLPESILVLVRDKSQLANLSKYPFFAGKEFPEQKTIVFVCKNFSCSLPLASTEEVGEALLTKKSKT